MENNVDMNERNYKGITLIALVITIIVLLILAGVSIQILAGDNGLISRTIDAKEKTEKAAEFERVKLAVLAAEQAGQGTIATSDLRSELINLNEKSELTGDGNWIYIGEKNKYLITTDGNVFILQDVYNRIYGNTQNKSVLPEGYIQVEYIESTGTQYIDTEEKANDIKEINIKFCITKDVDNHQGILGGGYSQNNDTFQVLMNNFNKTIAVAWGESRIGIELDKEIHSAKLSSTKVVMDNVEENVTDQINDERTVYLFARKGDNLQEGIQQYSYCKIYNCELYDKDKIIHNFTPCYKKENNISKIGFYDTVSKQFYENKGEGKFKKGNTIPIYKSVGDINNEGKYIIPIKVLQTDGEKMVSIALDQPLRKKGDVADYIDLANKKVVRYIKVNNSSEDASFEERYSILESPIEENIDLDDIDVSKIISLSVETTVLPSEIR